MYRLPCQLFLLAIVPACLTGCVATGLGSVARPPVYDVRAVAVIGDKDMPLRLLSGTEQRVRASIGSTRRIQPMERVVLTVKYQHYRPARTVSGDKAAMAEFVVTAADIESGNPVAAGTFVVRAQTANPQWADESLAEEAASRIRFAFSLRQPTMAKAVRPEIAAPALRSVQTAYAPVGHGMPDERVFEVTPDTGALTPITVKP